MPLPDVGFADPTTTCGDWPNRSARSRRCTYRHVEAGFLELAEPGIGDGLAALAATGETEIVTFPCFLAAGTHVAQDIPRAIAGFSAAYPGVKVRLTRHLGLPACHHSRRRGLIIPR